MGLRIEYSSKVSPELLESNSQLQPILWTRKGHFKAQDNIEHKTNIKNWGNLKVQVTEQMNNITVILL